MALQKPDGTYHKAARLEAIDFYNKKAYIRFYGYANEAARKDDFANPEENYCVQEIDVPDDKIAVLQEMAYELAKAHKVKIGEERHPAETDENGDVIKEAWTEELIDYPFDKWLDLL